MCRWSNWRNSWPAGGGEHLRQPAAVRRRRGFRALPAHPGCRLRQARRRRLRPGVRARRRRDVPGAADLHRAAARQPGERPVRRVPPRPFQRRRHRGAEALQPGAAARGGVRQEGFPAAVRHPRTGAAVQPADRDHGGRHPARGRRPGDEFAQRLSRRIRAHPGHATAARTRRRRRSRPGGRTRFRGAHRHRRPSPENGGLARRLCRAARCHDARGAHARQRPGWWCWARPGWEKPG